MDFFLHVFIFPLCSSLVSSNINSSTVHLCRVKKVNKVFTLFVSRSEKPGWGIWKPSTLKANPESSIYLMYSSYFFTFMYSISFLGGGCTDLNMPLHSTKKRPQSSNSLKQQGLSHAESRRTSVHITTIREQRDIQKQNNGIVFTVLRALTVWKPPKCSTLTSDVRRGAIRKIDTSHR